MSSLTQLTAHNFVATCRNLSRRLREALGKAAGRVAGSLVRRLPPGGAAMPIRRLKGRVVGWLRRARRRASPAPTAAPGPRKHTGTRMAYTALAFVALGCVAALGSDGGAGPPAGGQPETVLAMLKKGGPLVWPLLGCLLGALYVALDRFLVIRQCCVLPAALVRRLRRLDTRPSLPADSLTRLCGKSQAVLSRLVAFALDLRGRPAAETDQALADARRREFAALDRKTHWLATFASLAPMLGLAGTVQGMIVTFRVVSQHGAGDPRLMAAGIYTSLVATFCGIAIAAPCVALYRFFTAKVDRMHDEAEELLARLRRRSSS